MLKCYRQTTAAGRKKLALTLGEYLVMLRFRSKENQQCCTFRLIRNFEP